MYRYIVLFLRDKVASTVTLLDAEGEVQFVTDYRGPPAEFQPQNRRPYNAFAPNGSFEVGRDVKMCSLSVSCEVDFC